MANVFNNELIVIILYLLAVYLFIRGTLIFMEKAGKAYTQNTSPSYKKLHSKLISGYYIISGFIVAFIPTVNWKTEDIYFGIAFYAFLSLVYWGALDYLMNKMKMKSNNKSLQEN